MFRAMSKWIDFLPRLNGNGSSAKHLQDFYMFAKYFDLEHGDGHEDFSKALCGDVR